DDCDLVGGGEVGRALAQLALGELAHLVQQRRLDPGEGEVEPTREVLARAAPAAARASPRGTGERERVAISPGGQALERRPARVAEPEQPGALVEGLSGGVVERAPEHFESVVILDQREERVSTTRDQADERGLECGRIL